MFHSGAKSTSTLAKFDKEGGHVNGLVLGIRDSVYIAKTISDLASAYDRRVRGQPELKPQEFQKEVYLEALVEVFSECSSDDRKRFGR